MIVGDNGSSAEGTVNGIFNELITGRIHWVQIDLDKDAEDSDNLITPEERYQVAMTRQ